MGMPRRVYTYLPGQGLDTGNLISSIGAFSWRARRFTRRQYYLYLNKGKYVGNDPWLDGRTLEWAVSSPPPEYNFKQLPFVRGLDPLWIEKQAGNEGMAPAEPVEDIHMPNGSIMPFIISFGLFVAAFGFLYHSDYSWGFRLSS